MRLRNAVLAAVGALTLVLAVPGSALGATGHFQYEVGPGIARALSNPPSRDCINLPGATEEDPAFSPWNDTDATAVVFLDEDCHGDTFYVMPPGKRLGPRLKLRSVSFS
jgi:hypothetical protein